MYSLLKRCLHERYFFSFAIFLQLLLFIHSVRMYVKSNAIMCLAANVILWIPYENRKSPWKPHISLKHSDRQYRSFYAFSVLTLKVVRLWNTLEIWGFYGDIKPFVLFAPCLAGSDGFNSEMLSLNVIYYTDV